MSILFTPANIAGLKIKNRFVRSATYDGMANRDGFVTAKQAALFEDLAKGGIGLIVSGIAHVNRSGRISPIQNAIDRDECIPSLKGLTDRVHESGAKIAIQLFHGGREVGRFKPQAALSAWFVENDPWFPAEYRAMTEDEIMETVKAFGDGARRAKDAGFDAVQLHGAHAYLLAQFLSPYSNRRQDDWGGSLTNRLRLHTEIYKDIRKKTGPDYPVTIKLGVEDGFEGGLTFQEGLEAARMLSEIGFDSLEISSGLRGEDYEGTEFKTRMNKPERQAYFRSWASEVKQAVSAPVMMVGGLRRIEQMEEVVSNGEADFVSLSRPFIREPDLVESWRAGEKRRPACISCNLCFKEIFNGTPLTCAAAELKAAKSGDVPGAIS